MSSGMTLRDDGDNGEIAVEPGRDTATRDPRDAESTPAGTGKQAGALLAVLQLKIQQED